MSNIQNLLEKMIDQHIPNASIIPSFSYLIPSVSVSALWGKPQSVFRDYLREGLCHEPPPIFCNLMEVI